MGASRMICIHGRFPIRHLPRRTIAGALLAAVILSGLAAAGQPAAPPPDQVAEEKAQLSALRQEQQKQHDEAVQKAFAEYHKLMGAARVPGERAAVLAKLAGAEKDPRILSELSSRLSDADVVRAEAIAGLGNYHGDERAAQALMRALPANAQNPGVQSKILDALAAVGHPTALTTASGFLRHGDAQVAASAARALGEMHSVAAIEPLLASWEAVDQERKKGGDAQRAAEERLGVVGGPLRDALAKLTGQPLGATTEYRVWWIKNRSTYRIKEPPPRPLCTEHFHAIEPPGPWLPTGAIAHEVWTNLPGANVDSLVRSGRLQSPPDQTRALTAFEAPSNIGDNYGARIRGYLHPPVDGAYRFWMASDDEAYLYLSSDSLPGRKVLIAKSGTTAPRVWSGGQGARSEPIELKAGRRYYVEALHKEQVGNDHISVAWDLPGGARELIPGNCLAPFAPIAGTTAKPPPASSAHPAPSGPASASDKWLSTGIIVHEVWTGIPGESIAALLGSGRLQTPPDRTNELSSLDAPSKIGENYGARIRGYLHPPIDGAYRFWLASDDESELYLSPDEHPARRALRVKTGYCDMRAWTLGRGARSEPIELKAGRRYYLEVLHKQGSGGDHLSVAWDLPGGARELIAGESLSPFAPIAGAAAKPPPASTPPPAKPLPTGTIVHEVWTGIPGSTIADLLGACRLHTLPDQARELTSFEAPSNIGDNYGARIRGYLHPPTDGAYRFWLASDDESELFLSPDDHPARRVPILKTGVTEARAWAKGRGARSNPIELKAGRRYYIELLHKEGGVTDYVSVAWELSGVSPELIPGQCLSPFAEPKTAPPPAPVVVKPPAAPPPPPPPPTPPPPRPAAPDRSSFYRAINFNGPAVTLDGRRWEASAEAPNCLVSGRPYGNPEVSLEPAVEGDQAKMLKTAMTISGTMTVVLSRVPAGTYQVYLHAWSEGSEVRFGVALKGRVVATDVTPGKARHWQRLGPWAVEVNDGLLEIECRGGAVNVCGMEAWRQ
jgi:hypothetical protein